MNSSNNSNKNLVLLHYFGGDVGSWQWLYKKLPTDFNTMVMDLPGFGNRMELDELSIERMAQTVYADIQSIGLDKLTVLGHSMSGKLALLIGKLDQGRLIDKLILLAPSPPTVEKMSDNDRLKMLDQYDLDRAAQNVDDGTYGSISIDKKQYAIDSQLRVEPDTWNWWVVHGMVNNILSEVSDLKQELHLIYAKEDKAVPLEQMQTEVIDKLNFTSIHKMEEVGHLIPLEKPTELADLIKKILN